MAVVLSTEESSMFSSTALRRSHSQPKFGSKHTRFRTSSSTSRISEIYHEEVDVFPDSTPSSTPSSPHSTHTDLIDFSVPKSAPNLPISAGFNPLRLGDIQPEEQFSLPQYDDVGFDYPVDELEPPPSPRGLGDSYSVSPNDNNTSADTSRPDSPDQFEHPADDTAVRAQPTRHVDYLSHDWREEDIWESWKYIVSRRGEVANWARLENASWRTWIKAKNNLKTVSPETLNWLKDCDVTWLYGPLQTGSSSWVPSRATDSVELSKSNSFISKKPILKKRSMSEIMLQKSLSSSSLIKQAAAAVQAQQKEGGGRTSRPRLERATTDYVTFPFSSRRASTKSSSVLASTASSGIVSPSVERKHIHFNEQVAQCIAVDAKGDEEETDADTDRFTYDSDSDDGAIMMKRTASKKRRPVLRRKYSSSNTESKTIAMLPSTTLKYREDTPEPPETAMKHSYRSPVISPSSSQETLRPAKPSGKLFFAGDDEEEDDDDEDDELPVLARRSGTPKPPSFADNASNDRSSGLKRSTSSNALGSEPAGMRRTESGMFMPYEEGEPAGANGGIVGRVIDTVNTARDIAHVIWNVGWRK